MSKKPDTAADTKAQLQEGKPSPRKIVYADGLSSGSSLINCACTGRSEVGFLPGYLYVWVGDSGSGKTFITLTTLAEAAKNPIYDDYRLVFDQPERGALMDFKRCFGAKMADRVEDPSKDGYSKTLEEFYYNVDRNVAKGSCIYLLDSMDALTPKVDIEKFRKGQRAIRDGEKEAGSYGTAKAKINSQNLRLVHNELPKTGSILVIISQTRQSIGYGAFLDPKTRGGGKALTFYAALELWTSVKTHLKKKVSDKKSLEQGVLVKVRVRKGRLCGKDRSVEVPIYHSGAQPGIDETGSCIDYLVEWGHWKKAKGIIDADDFQVTLRREDLIQHIENLPDGPKNLMRAVGRVWREVEKTVEVERKPRYE